ncbi:hypothetical protein O3P69_020215 [Scylla paramamosain]|uniref:Nuclease HARBI1 n=1 Tax=Scylla paramamosain TaxID=85552 RepID=A0AAW0TKB5_SCYPA
MAELCPIQQLIALREEVDLAQLMGITVTIRGGLFASGLALSSLRISPSLQLLVMLRYLATGHFQLTVADTADVSQVSVSHSIRRVVHAIAVVSACQIPYATRGGEISVMRQQQQFDSPPPLLLHHRE